MRRKRMCLSFVSSLKDCAEKKDLYEGTRIHADIRNSGLLENNTYLGNTLVSMYVKCGALVRAQQVLEELPVRNVVSWNALIAGYAQHECGQEALDCFQRLRSEGVCPDAVTYTCILKACGTMQDADMGKRIHEDIVNQGLLKENVVLGTALVDMYAKCGVFQEAQTVLNQLPVRNVVSWSALIAGYTQQGQGQKALSCFHYMQREGISPNVITYFHILKACGITQDVEMGKRIHDDIASQGLLEKEEVIGNALVKMYAKCGSLLKAQKVLEELPVRNVICWSALIAGYVKHGQAHEALGCFQRMRSEGISPDAITYACTLKACGTTQDADMGKQIHDDVVREGLLKENVVLGTALVDMYAKCGKLQKAQEVLEKLPVRNVVSWSALIAGYVEQGHGREALGCFQQMRSEGISPDAITYICTLKACGTMQDADMGTKVHDEIVSQGLLKKEVELGNALVDMYVKCGVLQKAQQVLEVLPIRNVVCWSALIAGYAEQGQGQEALGYFQQMRQEGISPNAITYTCILKACGLTQDADVGRSIHNDIVSLGLLTKDVELGNALVDMYVKCGVLQKAQNVLEELPVRNVVSWNALIAGYAQNRQGQEAVGCFQQMQREGVAPDAITYACILKACGATQDAEMGKRIHDDIVRQGLLKKEVVLGNALVDMYAKCRVLQKAQKVLEELPIRNVISWSALIAGYAQQGQDQEALGCFEQMQREGLCPNAITWNALITGYAQHGQVQETLGCFHRMLSEGVSPDDITYALVLKAMLTS